jgi:hypothetical protein
MPSPTLNGTASRLLTVTGMTGIAYTLSWVAGVSIAPVRGGAVHAYVSGPLLLLFITGSGIVLGGPSDQPALNPA